MREDCVIKVEDLSKEYRLGVIGTGTLQNDLQSWWAKKRGKEDPNRKIGDDKVYIKGDRFYALKDMNIEIDRGERVGIIGSNGAGKSTFLKLLSRITSPTRGEFCFRGRIASMLEVGTGFHPELTGRQNIYLNGAILGMKREEIDKKIEEIVEFSECEKFIDTPIKRYSSGMFVKLAFSVAAHLDAEIMIMDEVLAVGDVKFQKKCIDKMRELALKEDRTILYVSHNMNTIRDLCNRCIVLDHGEKVYDGSVEEAIKLYVGGENDNLFRYDYTDDKFKEKVDNNLLCLNSAQYNGVTSGVFYDEAEIPLELSWTNKQDIKNLSIRVEVYDYKNYPVTAFCLNDFYSGNAGEKHSQKMKLDVSRFAVGAYRTRYVFTTQSSETAEPEEIEIAKGLWFRKKINDTKNKKWQKSWGSIMMKEVNINS